MAQAFKCKTPGCEETVTYEHDPVPGTLGFEKEEDSQVTIEVYLTCDVGHTNKYEVRK